MAFAEARFPADFDMGRVAARTFSVIRHNLATFGLLILVMFIPLTVLTVGIIAIAVAERATGGAARNIVTAIMIAAPLYLIGDLVMQAGVVHGTVAYLNGKRASFRDCFTTGLKHFLPIIAIGLLMGLGIAAGLVLLIVPGIMLMMAWSVAIPARVVEHTGVIRSLTRSSELTSGHRWAIFGLYLCYGVLTMIIAVIPILNLATILILPVIRAAGIASIYYELRVIKEGIGPEALASVFD